jgi:hypothetical protein
VIGRSRRYQRGDIGHWGKEQSPGDVGEETVRQNENGGSAGRAESREGEGDAGFMVGEGNVVPDQWQPTGNNLRTASTMSDGGRLACVVVQ